MDLIFLIFLFLSTQAHLSRAWLSSDVCSCEGVHQAKNSMRISNGTKVDGKNLQFTAVIYLNDVTKKSPTKFITFCIGVLLNGKYAITNARCVGDMNKSVVKNQLEPYIALGGDLDFQTIFRNSSFNRAIKRILNHPSIKSKHNSQIRDIALVEVEKPFELGSKFNIYASCFHPINRTELIGSNFIVASYGNKSELFYTYLRQTNDSCKGFEEDELNNHTICLSPMPGETSGRPCQGDIGGPILLIKQLPTTPPQTKLVLTGILRRLAIDSRLTKLETDCRVVSTLVELVYPHSDWIQTIVKQDMCQANLSFDTYFPTFLPTFSQTFSQTFSPTFMPTSRTTFLSTINPSRREATGGEDLTWLYLVIAALTLFCLCCLYSFYYAIFKRRQQISAIESSKSTRSSFGASSSIKSSLTSKAAGSELLSDKLLSGKLNSKQSTSKDDDQVLSSVYSDRSKLSSLSHTSDVSSRLSNASATSGTSALSRTSNLGNRSVASSPSGVQSSLSYSSDTSKISDLGDRSKPSNLSTLSRTSNMSNLGNRSVVSSPSNVQSNLSYSSDTSKINDPRVLGSTVTQTRGPKIMKSRSKVKKPKTSKKTQVIKRQSKK